MKIPGRYFAFTTVAALAASLGASVLASQASATTAHSFVGGYSVIHNSGSSRPATTVALAAASVPACTAGDLGVWVAADQGDGAAGTAYVPLEFTNLSHHTCTLHGFPGVSAISSSGRQLGSPAVWDHGVPGTHCHAGPGRDGVRIVGIQRRNYRGLSCGQQAHCLRSAGLPTRPDPCRPCAVGLRYLHRPGLDRVFDRAGHCARPRRPRRHRLSPPPRTPALTARPSQIPGSSWSGGRHAITPDCCETPGDHSHRGLR